MVMDFSISAVHGVNRFVWSKLQSDLGWKSSDYGGLIPITTPQQQQELNDMNRPYLMYNYRTSTVGGMYGYKEEYVIYSINSPTESDVRKVLGLLDYYLSGQDKSAELINDYVYSLNPNPYKQFDYKSLSVRSGSGAEPTTQEGGLMDGTFEYTIRFTSSRLLGFEE